ncbi:MAG: hypothetical protein WCT52_03195 [Candidatus Micrarchaeia archaeon]
MQKTKPMLSPKTDYVEVYEKAMQDVVAACGSKEIANSMLDELHGYYQTTERRLKDIEKKHGNRGEIYIKEKERALETAKYDVHRIVDKYVPNASWHLEELIMGASLAVTATLLPSAQAAGTLIAATGIVAIGGSYYIGFKLLRNWKAIAGKHRLAGFVGRNLPKFKLAKKG